MNRTSMVVFLAAGAALAITSTANANVFGLSSVIAARGNQIPDQPVGVLYGNFNSPSIAADGRVTFGGSGILGLASASNDRAVFSGFSAATVGTVAQSGTQAPGGPAGALMQSGTGASFALNTSSSRTNAAGSIMYVSAFSGGGVTANVNDSAVFVGSAGGSFAPIARRGISTVAGTGGAVLSAAFDTSTQSLTQSADGTVYFKQTMTGGDVSGTTNNTGVFAATPAGVSIVARKGTQAPGAAAGVNYNNIGFITQPNASALFMYDSTLAGAGVTTANDSALFVHTPGAGSTLIAREGQVAPGSAGATFSGAYTAPGVTFNNSGTVLFQTNLAGGDVVGTTNDSAIFMRRSGALNMIVRKGQAAPGTDGAFATLSGQSTLYLNNSGSFVFQGLITGGSVTAANDSGIWVSDAANPSSLSLLLREGDVAPGTQTQTLAFGSNSLVRNALGQMLVSMPLSNADGTAAGNALYAYDPAAAVPFAILCRSGEQIEIAPGVFKTIANFGSLQFTNGAGGPLSLNDSGGFVISVNTAEGFSAVVTGQIPAPGAGALALLGAASLAARRRRLA